MRLRSKVNYSSGRMCGVEELYKNFGTLADAGEDDIHKYSFAYEGIIRASKGSSGEKILAPGFITRFFRHFPTSHDAAIDAILDLIEDEDPQVRRLAIKSLPDICKGAKDDNLYVRVSDALTQLLPIEDSTDLGLVKSSMALVLEMNTKSALIGIFDQIMSEDETIREKGLEYVCGPLISLKQKLFSHHPKNEEFLAEQIKKVLVDVTGEEFECLIEVLSQLSYMSSSEGSRLLSDMINEQAELVTEFKADDTEYIDKFTTCFKQAIKFYKNGFSLFPFVEYLCVHIFPVMNEIKEDQTRQELLQLLAEASLCSISPETSTVCIQHVFNLLMSQLPLPPDAGGDQPKLHFSTMECILFTFHVMCQKLPEFLVADEKKELLKDLRTRLQYFARGSQTYHSQLKAALKGKNFIDLKEEQNKVRGVALKTTENINALIKDFFHNPPSYRTTILLSWVVKNKSPRQHLKRPGVDHEISAKRKPSPIRFQDKDTVKKKSVSIYSPPKDKFSGTGPNFEDYQSSQKGRGGRGRKRMMRGKS